ncbi:hypothetical protein PYW08_010719 [Mythimna loreyi]|uniref:Uncharacterized protein n=1 Tax=Mythimna loreyi TaxID=667449 RepID=A0ACC2Q3V3_9NEOP|nr:hypothetical protein PYW08_010719 [Mythimna loreyi]
MAGHNTSINEKTAFNTSVTNVYNISAHVTSVNHTSAYETSPYNTSAIDTSAFNSSVTNTSAYDTSAFNSSVTNTSDDTNIFIEPCVPSAYYLIVFAWIIIVLSLTGLLYGVTSWCIIKKFRHLRNYVLLNLMITNMIRYSLFVYVESNCFLHYIHLVKVQIVLYLFEFWALTFNCWLLVLCYIFYIDFVNVFNKEISRRYLKSNLFAWGVPFAAILLYFITGRLLYAYCSMEILTTPIGISLLLLPVTISFVVYVMVVYSLFWNSKAPASTSSDKRRRLYISTLIFVLSNVMVLYCLRDLFEVTDKYVNVLGVFGEFMNIIALDTYFILGKFNRELWQGYFKKRSLQTSLGV